MLQQNLELLPTAEICFQHDLEDGWYAVNTPTKTWLYFDDYPTAIARISKEGWQHKWVGDERYNPERSK